MVPVEPAAPRVLQILGDTDLIPPHEAALILHECFSESGLQVRTLALAPGRRGGLEVDVPTLSPARRSFAARSQFVTESRWSDVVVLHGDRSLTAAVRPVCRSERPFVIALWEPLHAPPRRWSSTARLLGSAEVVVVPSAEVAEAVEVMTSPVDPAPVLITAADQVVHSCAYWCALVRSVSGGASCGSTGDGP